MMIYEQKNKDGHGLKWVHLHSPTKEELKIVGDRYEVPDDYLTAVLDPYEIARVENLKKYDQPAPTLILLEYILPAQNYYHNTEFSTRPFAIILVDNIIITLTMELTDFLDTLFNDLFYSNLTPLPVEEIIANILWQTERFCVSTIKTIFTEIKDLQKDIIKSSSNRELYRLMTIERSLISIQTTINNNLSVIEQLLKLPHFDSGASDQLNLNDVYVESLQAESMVQEALLMTDRLSAIISNVISNNLNNIMKVLTSITIILTIPTIIAGIWGMNVPVPWGKNPYGFLILILLNVILMIITLLWLKNKDLL